MKISNQYKKTILGEVVIPIACLSLVLGLAACQEENGPAEKVGQKIDMALENVEHKYDAAIKNAEKKTETAKESIKGKIETTGVMVDDSIISANVKAAIIRDSFMKASHIEVTTSKGEVTLKGTVDSEPIIGRAMEIASSQKNVKSVKTELIVPILTE